MNLTPEQLRMLQGIVMGPDGKPMFIDDQAAQLQDQLARAHALRDSSVAKHSTGLGGALGGLGHLLDVGNGMRQSADVEARQRALAALAAQTATDRGGLLQQMRQPPEAPYAGPMARPEGE